MSTFELKAGDQEQIQVANEFGIDPTALLAGTQLTVERGDGVVTVRYEVAQRDTQDRLIVEDDAPVTWQAELVLRDRTGPPARRVDGPS